MSLTGQGHEEIGRKSKRDRTLTGKSAQTWNGRKAMAKQFENPEAEKVEDETAEDLTPEEKVEHVAEKLARKPAERSKEYDKEHDVFTK
jgi:hypothetical protein